MAIMRIEEVTYGVEDLASCTRFFADAGFEPAAKSQISASFRTPVNQFVHLRLIDDPALPPANAPGPNIREIIWGVDDAAGLAALQRELARDRPVRVDADGSLHTHDETGFRIGFKLAAPEEVAVDRQHTNLMGEVQRRNAGVQPHGRARPLRIIHVALDIRKDGREKANAFYLERLNFRAIDHVVPMGTFMQCEGDIEHHNFLLVHRPDQVSVNHIALEVRDFDEVVEGGNYMTEHGWKESRRLGRHNLGSNVFRMFHAPCGGRIEFASDMDRMDKTFVPRIWEVTPPHHLWMLKFPGDTDR
jgi:catechol 2,3-dioxygenase-like lactoylglutathione lyase family enzyme